jgi:predicted RNase H-like HicB family nuclease
MRYLIVIRKTGTGYSADAPDLPGCVAAASTVEKTRKLMATAVRMHIDLMRRSGEQVPKPRRKIELTPDDVDEQDYCSWVEVSRRKAGKVASGGHL